MDTGQLNCKVAYYGINYRLIVYTFGLLLLYDFKLKSNSI